VRASFLLWYDAPEKLLKKFKINFNQIINEKGKEKKLTGINEVTNGTRHSLQIPKQPENKDALQLII
jgi:hypothetical protein